MMNILALLRENLLLRGCPEEVLATIQPLVTAREVAEGGVVFRQGEPAEAMYLVLGGSVHLNRNNPSPDASPELLATVGSGDFFGDMALLDHEPHVVDAVTAQTSFLGQIDRAGMEEILRLAPHVVPLNFVRAVHRRVKGANAHFTAEILRGERLHHVGTMAGAIIHDFKTPLTAIRCACDLLETQAHDETHRRMAEIIKRSVERMMAMTQELLDYTLGASAPLQFAPVSIGHLLAELDDQCLHDLPRQGIVVERRIAYDGDVEVDLMRFERMLLNIIQNAREAMRGGGRLCLSVERQGEGVVFAVEDNGRGMSPEVAAKIFEPFFTHAKPQGTGLGMSMVKSVVDAHRGSIRVESQLRCGTRFEIWIPLRQPKPATPPAA